MSAASAPLTSTLFSRTAELLATIAASRVSKTPKYTRLPSRSPIALHAFTESSNTTPAGTCNLGGDIAGTSPTVAHRSPARSLAATHPSRVRNGCAGVHRIPGWPWPRTLMHAELSLLPTAATRRKRWRWVSTQSPTCTDSIGTCPLSVITSVPDGKHGHDPVQMGASSGTPASRSASGQPPMPAKKCAGPLIRTASKPLRSRMLRESMRPSGRCPSTTRQRSHSTTFGSFSL